jgi:hypothetical protein
LLIEALRELHSYYGSTFQIELPHGTGRQATLEEAAAQIAGRLARIFLRDASGRRPVFGGQELFHSDPHWRDHIPFYEYFHGDNGSGLGASHQTGWTSLVADLIAWKHEWSTAQIKSSPATPSGFPAPASAKLGTTPCQS